MRVCKLVHVFSPFSACAIFLIFMFVRVTLMLQQIVSFNTPNFILDKLRCRIFFCLGLLVVCASATSKCIAVITFSKKVHFKRSMHTATCVCGNIQIQLISDYFVFCRRGFTRRSFWSPLYLLGVFCGVKEICKGI